MSETSDSLLTCFPYLKRRPSADCPAYNCPPGQLVSTVQRLKDEHGFELLVDVTAVDWENTSPRFSAFYHLYSLSKRSYLRLVVDCGDDADPRVPSISMVHSGANWHERETYDMFGIHFDGHPDLRRILMWDDYPYFPLRKEFPLAGKEVPFPAADVAEETGVRVQAAPMMGGPFVAATSGPMSRAEPRARDESWTEKHEKPFED